MGFQDVLYCANRDQGAVTKRVYYQGTNTIYEGMALCYNHDTTTNISGLTSGVTAEGSQNEGKYFYVEEPSEANAQFFAGVVARGSWCGTTGPCYLDVFIPNGSMVPVRTNANCVLGVTVLGLVDGSNLLQVVAGDEFPVALVMETVDRSGTNDIVLAKVSAPSAGIVATNAYFAPTRSVTTGDFEGIKIEGSNALTGAGAADGTRSYVVSIEAYKTAGAFTVYGQDDAGLRINMNNRVAAGSVYTMRGLNCSATVGNSSGSQPGSLGVVENMISVANKVGSTAPTMRALSMMVENYGTCATELGGLKIDLRNEGAVATTEYGIWCHNSNNSIADSVGCVLKVSDTGANTGWDNLLDLTDATGTIAVEDSLAYPDKAGSIKIILPSGAAGYINIYDGAKA